MTILKRDEKYRLKCNREWHELDDCYDGEFWTNVPFDEFIRNEFNWSVYIDQSEAEKLLKAVQIIWLSIGRLECLQI